MTMKDLIKKRINEEDGTLTVFMTLILVSMMAFLLILIDMSRVTTAKNYAEDATRLAVNTVLSDYDTDLRREYGLFAFRDDISARAYDTVAGSIGGNNMVNLSVKSVNVERDPAYILGNQTILKGQIMDTMKYMYEYTDIIESIDIDKIYLDLSDGVGERFENLRKEDLDKEEEERQKRIAENELKLVEEGDGPENLSDTTDEGGDSGDTESDEERLRHEKEEKRFGNAMKRITRAENLLSDIDETLDAVNKRSDEFVLAGYVKGFFSGEYNTSEFKLNGQPMGGDSRDRDYIIYGNEEDGFTEDLRDILFYIEVSRLTAAAEQASGERMTVDEILSQAEILENEAYEELISGKYINVGKDGNRCRLSYDSFEFILITKRCMEDETGVIGRIKEVIERNMQVMGEGGFSLDNVYTKAYIEAEFKAESSYIDTFFGETGIEDTTMKGVAVY